MESETREDGPKGEVVERNLEQGQLDPSVLNDEASGTVNTECFRLFPVDLSTVGFRFKAPLRLW